jgi:hypothetical protein
MKHPPPNDLKPHPNHMKISLSKGSGLMAEATGNAGIVAVVILAVVALCLSVVFAI